MTMTCSWQAWWDFQQIPSAPFPSARLNRHKHKCIRLEMWRDWEEWINPEGTLHTSAEREDTQSLQSGWKVHSVWENNAGEGQSTAHHVNRRTAWVHYDSLERLVCMYFSPLISAFGWIVFTDVILIKYLTHDIDVC